jgi:hypothetical protein
MRHETWDMRHETWDMRHETWDMRHETWDMRFQKIISYKYTIVNYWNLFRFLSFISLIICIFFFYKIEAKLAKVSLLFKYCICWCHKLRPQRYFQGPTDALKRQKSPDKWQHISICDNFPSHSKNLHQLVILRFLVPSLWILPWIHEYCPFTYGKIQAWQHLDLMELNNLVAPFIAPDGSLHELFGAILNVRKPSKDPLNYLGSINLGAAMPEFVMCKRTIFMYPYP